MQGLIDRPLDSLTNGEKDFIIKYLINKQSIDDKLKSIGEILQNNSDLNKEKLENVFGLYEPNRENAIHKIESWLKQYNFQIANGTGIFVADYTPENHTIHVVIKGNTWINWMNLHDRMSKNCHNIKIIKSSIDGVIVETRLDNLIVYIREEIN